MSLISGFYDAVNTRLAAVFPNHAKLSNPYDIAQNTELALKQGYGFSMGSATNTNRNTACHLSTRRSVNVTIARQFFATELNRTGKENTEKDLLEDLVLVIKEFEGDPTLAYGNLVANFGYESDNGIETVFSDENNFLKITAVFGFEIFEAY